MFRPGTNSKDTESSSRDDRDKSFGKSGKDDKQQNKNSKKGVANQSGDTRVVTVEQSSQLLSQLEKSL